MKTLNGKECCEQMENQINYKCDLHHGVLSDCPDILVSRFKSGEYVILIHDGGSSGIIIKYCPWCGTELKK